MKKWAFILGMLCFISCSNDDDNTSTPTSQNPTSYGYTATTPEISQKIVTSNNTVVGNMQVINTEGNLYITYKVDSKWTLKNISLFVGKETSIPIKKEALSAAEFPHQANFKNTQTTYKFTVPLFKISKEAFECICICSKVMVQNTEDTTNLEEEECWSGDISYSKDNWGTYFHYCPPQQQNESELKEF
ncbi:hypothetical protein [Flavobacterium agrisoli]|uniref:Uncharacterized protein n=1 Tax=Flavobacterium agrisoli TaxID=2793066 RepID=A0A934PL18_9FLAO|nr:hypothetical protein [Flavobacterium agrisoli]MBK0368720.1 hypothetical protein [Flavobacterium agrisoli]